MKTTTAVIEGIKINCLVNESETWNGFLIPWVTLEEFKILCKQSEQVKYGVLFGFDGSKPCIVWNEYNETEQLEHIYNNGIELYNVGCGLVWEEEETEYKIEVTRYYSITLCETVKAKNEEEAREKAKTVCIDWAECSDYLILDDITTETASF